MSGGASLLNIIVQFFRFCDALDCSGTCTSVPTVALYRFGSEVIGFSDAGYNEFSSIYLHPVPNDLVLLPELACRFNCTCGQETVPLDPFSGNELWMKGS